MMMMTMMMITMMMVMMVMMVITMMTMMMMMMEEGDGGGGGEADDDRRRRRRRSLLCARPPAQLTARARRARATEASRFSRPHLSDTLAAAASVQLRNIQPLLAPSSVRGPAQVNMNQTGDDHVSFTALDLVISPPPPPPPNPSPPIRRTAAAV